MITCSKENCDSKVFDKHCIIVYLSKLDKKYLLYVSLIFALIFISNLKGGFLFGRIIGDALLAIILGMIILKYKSSPLFKSEKTGVFH